MVDPEAPIPNDSPAPADALLAQEDGAAAGPITSTPVADDTLAGDFDPENPPAPVAGASAGGPARLVVKRNGAETDETFPLHSPATIGRFDPAVGPIDVDLAPLPEGQYVSRKHARLTESGGVWTIQDLGSSNGTFVLRDGDFAREESAELADGDEFALGNARFVLRLS